MAASATLHDAMTGAASAAVGRMRVTAPVTTTTVITTLTLTGRAGRRGLR